MVHNKIYAAMIETAEGKGMTFASSEARWAYLRSMGDYLREDEWTIRCIGSHQSQSVTEVLYRGNDAIGYYAPVYNWIDEQYHDEWFASRP